MPPSPFSPVPLPLRRVQSGELQSALGKRPCRSTPSPPLRASPAQFANLLNLFPQSKPPVTVNLVSRFHRWAPRTGTTFRCLDAADHPTKNSPVFSTGAAPADSLAACLAVTTEALHRGFVLGIDQTLPAADFRSVISDFVCERWDDIIPSVSASFVGVAALNQHRIEVDPTESVADLQAKYKSMLKTASLRPFELNCFSKMYSDLHGKRIVFRVFVQNELKSVTARPTTAEEEEEELLVVDLEYSPHSRLYRLYTSSSLKGLLSLRNSTLKRAV